MEQARPWAVVASIEAVGVFAVAQPLLDLLGRNPEFFIAQRFPSRDIILLAVGLIALPIPLWVLVLGIRTLSRWLGAITHLVVVTALAAAAGGNVLVTLGLCQVTPVVFFALAGSAGVVVAWVFARFPSVRQAFLYLGLAPLVVVVWFLFFTPTSQLVHASSTDLPEAEAVGNPVPVIMMMFDEFPEASIMHADGSLDSEHYPNLARLAADGVWYRNAISVSQQTEQSLPSMLTGVSQPMNTIPTIGDHPFTLFALLSDAYDVQAVETVTNLCPSYVCSNTSLPTRSPSERWVSVLSDVTDVYGHLVLPAEMSDRLPRIDQTWSDFSRQTSEKFDIIERFLAQVDDDRRLEVGRFLSILDNVSDQPPLRFAHFLYPHHPWNLTADGRLDGATSDPGSQSTGWGPDPWLVAQGWQRHLIQAQYADLMLGQVLDRLKRIGIYNDALILVVVDEGITIEPNTKHQRIITPDTIGTVADVPMFVKYPDTLAGVPAGSVDDLRAETTDLLPTIADVIDVTVPWKMDGVSLLDTETRSHRTSSVMLGSKGPVQIPVDEDQVRAVAAEKESWFQSGDPYQFAPRGWEDLLGRTDVTAVDDPSLSISLDQQAAIAAFDPGSDPVPSYLSGTINTSAPATGDEVLAVVVDGQV
ncbi:MAG TPA: sulfatase-like hydrolase/transferase, partial [Acidimicrobiia bacterium]|nr:sulfatase-like hydrolase/transferase [Acidimicrobiia bacterium]